VPALLGIFWGAPLMTREFETGTYRVAWTQSITRSRWTLTKLGLGAAVTILVSGALTLTITWWYRVLDPISSNKYDIFDRRDIVPVAYALFAFAAGALIGAILRRTVPAMATTLAVFIFGRVAVSLWVRPHLLTAVTKTESLAHGGSFGIESTNGATAAIVAGGDGPQNSMLLSSHMLTASGQPATLAIRTAFVQQHCPSIAVPPGGPIAGKGGPGHAVAFPTPAKNDPAVACLHQAAHTFKLVVRYLPADRYWALQWFESGIFAALAIVCCAGSYWWVTRRTS
jgi:hypothetical protein